jgi:hypothetical protein
MKLSYYPDTDSRYATLISWRNLVSRAEKSLKASSLDYDAAGNIVGVDIDDTSQKVALKELTLSKLPFVLQTIMG